MPTLYHREYYLKNKDKLQRRAKIYYKKHGGEIQKRINDLYEKNPEIRQKRLATNRKYYLANKEKVLNQKSLHAKEYQLENRQKAINALGGKCKTCGFSDVRALQIDHINNNGNEERKILVCSTNSKKYYEHVLTNISDYQLLCANCNWIKEVEYRKTQTRYYKMKEAI